MIVSLDPEFTNFVLQQEKSFETWCPESFKTLLGSDNLLTCAGSVHKYTRNLILRVFGPENLRLQLLHEVDRIARTNLVSWVDRSSIDLKLSISSGRKSIMKALKQLLDEKQKNTERQERMDLLSLLIRDLEMEKHGLTEEYVLNVLFSIVFASFETTSTALTVALKFLMDNPAALQELTEEHEQILKARTNPDSGITWEEYKSMKFTSHVSCSYINCYIEGLRLANVTVVMFRKATGDVRVKAYTVPEGWTVMICPSANHLNPATYNDPQVFNPRRWKDISEPSGGSMNFLAFGRGPRYCAGAEFAKLQMAIFLHYLVTKYRWTLVRGGNMVLSPAPQFPNGFHVQVLPK
ncbi:hypothetical protein PR202_gb25411 [Eleusine coracana subsp. coracana]|uniref:Uncharacterized protein n=1 Tax=Eleusine coracana subsp. coracana TaxID=191504 RepID=A0AAV5FQ37_ELECO|nr:hypothetical protein PR202_gb25411 [Eleusine coracana subsp. coracana]